MRDAARHEHAAVCLRRVRADVAVRTDGEDDRLLILGPGVSRKQERRVSTAADRSADHALEDPPLFRRPDDCEGVSRVESRVAEDGVRFAVVLL